MLGEPAIRTASERDKSIPPGHGRIAEQMKESPNSPFPYSHERRGARRVMYAMATEHWSLCPERAREPRKQTAFAKSKTDSLLHLPHTSTGVNSRCQIPNSGTWRLSGQHSRTCQGNKQEYGQSNSNHSGPPYSAGSLIICVLGLVLRCGRGPPGQGKSQ